MYVCLCRQVTDRCVAAAIEAGARDPDSLVRSCRAGTGCGGCLDTVKAMLRAAIAACGDGDRPTLASQHQ